MESAYLLTCPAAQRLYEETKDLPIADYHCHLSPREILEDRVFDNIGEMWLGGDHYKWRLMRAFGVDEQFITGNAGWHDKFVKYLEAVETAALSPLYLWSAAELSRVFGIDDRLCAANAESIWEKANAAIRAEHLSPRKLIRQARVVYIATTDDPADTLEYHGKLRADKSFPVRVCPSFRTDRLLQIRKPDYAAYCERLGAAAGIPITDLSSLKEAIRARLNAFAACGCTFTDVGIPDFPTAFAPEAEADGTFRSALAGKTISDSDYNAFLGHLYLFLAKEYAARDMVMQLHLAVMRNVNTAMFALCGADSGHDTAGDTVSGRALATLLDRMAVSGGLPVTILYSLNAANAGELASVAGAFRGVLCGAAWWFCDHKRGIREQIETIAEYGHIGKFPGMLTDSRSFLSYARHDYFRRIFCSFLGELTEAGEFAPEACLPLCRQVFCENALALTAPAEKREAASRQS